jgi:UDP-glucose 4-epimerase
MKTCFIIGADGFIGSHAAEIFSGDGWALIGTGKNKPHDPALFQAFHNVQFPSDNFSDLIKQVKPSVCLHCAGNAKVRDSLSAPELDFQGGPIATFQILDAIRCYAPECKTIFISSAAVYGNPQSQPVKETHPLQPLSPYGFHKWQCEILCREFAEIYKLPIQIVRVFSAYGARLRRQIVWDICRKIKTGKRVELKGTGAEIRDFIEANDIARAFLTLSGLSNKDGLNIYNLASGQSISIHDLARKIISIFNKEIELVFTGEVDAGQPKEWHASVQNIIDTGWKPGISLDKGLENYVRWFQENT